MATQGSNAAPTIDQQIAAFKGVSAVDGVVNSAQDGGASPADDDATGDGETNDGGQSQPGQSTPKHASAQKRIDLAVQRQRAAERTRDATLAEMRAMGERLARIEGAIGASAQRDGAQPLTGGRQSANTQDPKAPNPASYQYGELDARYVADLARHEAQKAIETDRQQRSNETRQTAEAAELEQFQAFTAKGVEKFPDFHEVVVGPAQRNEWALSPTLSKLALLSDFGHELFYDLAQDPQEAARVYKMPTVEQARWFGRREAFYSARSPAANNGQGQKTAPNGAQTPGAVVRTTQAPPPPQIRLRGGGNPQPIAGDTADFAAFERMAMGDRRK